MNVLVNVHVKELRKGCPYCGICYDSLKEWLTNPNHIYIGRYTRGIEGSYKPDRLDSSAVNSPYCNPYKVKKGIDESLDIVLNEFNDYLYEKVKENPQFLEPLRGKTLGCWCVPNKCHGHIIKAYLNNDTDVKFN